MESNWRNQRKTCPSATLPTTNSVWTDLSTNPGLNGESLATKRLSHGKAYGGDQRCIKSWVEKLEGRGDLEDLVLGGKKAVPWLRRLVAGLSAERSGSVHVGSVVDRLTLVRYRPITLTTVCSGLNFHDNVDLCIFWVVFITIVSFLFCMCTNFKLFNFLDIF
jgi:hypothetical protein